MVYDWKGGVFRRERRKGEGPENEKKRRNEDDSWRR